MNTRFLLVHTPVIPIESFLRGIRRFSRKAPSEICHLYDATNPRRFLAGVASTCFVAGSPLTAQVFAPTSAPGQNWVSISSSADGSHVAAVASYGYVYLSGDSGASWMRATMTAHGAEPQRPWTALASSADGSKLVAVASFNQIFLSTDYGNTWNVHGPAANWASVASSADGTKLVALDYSMGAIYTSADSGLTWAATTAPAKRWRAVASSADGTRLVASTDFGARYNELPAIYTSADSGLTWTLTSAPNQPFQFITCSEDGTKVAAGVYGGLIYISLDGGTNWTAADVPQLHWAGLCSSGHFDKLTATASEGDVYYSQDSGKSWSRASAPQAQWQSVACTFDGSKVFAGIWNMSGDGAAGIYSSYLLSPVRDNLTSPSPASLLGPALEIKRSGNSAILSWPSTVPDFHLQQNSSLENSTWTDISVEPRLSDGRNEVSVPCGTGNHFFRLVRH